MAKDWLMSIVNDPLCHCVFSRARQNPEWQFGIWLQLTQRYQLSGNGQALDFPSWLPSYSLFNLMHSIFVYDQGDTSSNVFG